MPRAEIGDLAPRERRFAKWLFGVLIAIPLCCGGCVAGLPFFQNRQIDDQLAKLRELGLPTNSKELQAHARRDGENAAPFYQRAIEEWKTLASRSSMAALESNEPPYSPFAFFDAQIATFSLDPVWREFQQGSKRPVLDFNRDYRENPLEPTGLMPLKSIARAIAARARFLALAGDLREALRSLQVMDQVARHIESEPVLLPTLVSMSIRAMAMDATSDIVSMYGDERAALDDLKRYIQSLGPLPNFRNSFSGEPAIMLMYLRNEVQVDPSTLDIEDSGGMEGIRRVMRVGYVRRAVTINFAQWWTDAWRELPTDGSDWKSAYTVFKRHEHAADRVGTPIGKLTTIFLPFGSTAMRAWGRHLAQRRLALTSIELLQLRLRDGRPPRTMPNFGEMSIDPFTGKPLHYRSDARGFVVWSEEIDGDQGARKGRRDLSWEFKN